MRSFEGLERRYVKWRYGSSHANYRQPIWRTMQDDLSDGTAWSKKFEGNANAPYTTRKWRKAAIVGVDPFVWNDMITQCPEGLPALIFRDRVRNEDEAMPLRIGYLSSHEDLGRLKMLRRVGEEVHPYLGHGVRIGKYALQFTIALVSREEILTPPQEAIISQGPVDISVIGQPGSNYEHMYFSS